MANYVATSRTNYFGVKDRAAFFEELKMYSFEDIEVFEASDDSDKLAIAGYCDLSVGYNEMEDETVELAELISNHIKHDDACILTVSGNEKLRYVIAFAVAITSKGIHYVDAKALALESAKQMLGVDKFETQMAY